MTSPHRGLGQGLDSGTNLVPGRSAEGWSQIPKSPPPAMLPTNHPKSTHLQLTLVTPPSSSSASHPFHPDPPYNSSRN